MAVFGSFSPANLTTIDRLLNDLRKEGFLRAHRVEIDDPDISDADVLHECQELASHAERALFVLFKQPAEANQSAMIELTSRIKAPATGIDPRGGNTIILPQVDVKVRTLLSGFHDAADATLTDPWKSPSDLLRKATGALQATL